MKSVYLDNAATTPMDEKVIAEMTAVMRNIYGNPSSVHSKGREARAYIEKCRKRVAAHLGVSPAEIFFTSSGTEADNLAIRSSVKTHGIEQFISSKIEHHAVLHTLEEVSAEHNIPLNFVNLDELGHVQYDHLKQLLANGKKSFVALMHANNEIGNITDIKRVGELCKEVNALFLSDTVQSMGHYWFNFSELNVHFATCSAHKFHGPKGVGFIYIDSNCGIQPMLTGGAQERNMRAGTENVAGIAGLTKAMDLAYEKLNQNQKHLATVKKSLMKTLKKQIPGISFNGDVSGDSLHKVLNVQFPETSRSEMFLYNLDIEGICVSGGSACSSGSNVGSHVLMGIGNTSEAPSVRFSFSKFTTKADIDYTVTVLKKLFKK